MTLNPQIDDFIRLHRERLTREAITQQLEAAGHARPDIDAAWERLARDEPLGGPPTGNLSTYVWIVYWLGAVMIGAWAVITELGAGGTGIGLVFGIGWLALYLLLAYFPARALAQARTGSIAAGAAVVVAAPILVIVVGAGICIATIAVFAGLMS
jgi:hypothetical protein